MQPKFLIVMCWIALLCPIGRTQVKSGTVIVIVPSENRITMAGDSGLLLMDDAGRSLGKRNDECKIAAFGDQFAFAGVNSIGREEVPSVGRGPSCGRSWSAIQEARAAWESVKSQRPASPDFVVAVAKEWARRMKDILQVDVGCHPDESLQQAPHRNISIGHFIGSNSDGKLKAVVFAIQIDRDLFAKTREVKLHIVGGQVSPQCGVSASGKPEVANEFACQTSPLAKLYRETWEKRLATLEPSDRDAEFAIGLVNLSIALHPDLRSLFPPVDALQLEKGGKIKWVQRKAKCPEN